MTALLPGRADVDVATRLDALAAAVEHGEGRLDPAALEDARGVLERAGERLRLSGHHTVVALAGATGSGKSSLFNAIAGEQLAAVGVRRPTTSDAQACVWGDDGAGALLERLGVRRRNTTWREPHGAELDGLILLDLPDHDSTSASHRAVVDQLLPLVDLFVWVVDPQKYADAALHEGYLRPLSPHAAVMVVAFNQIDRLEPTVAKQALTDMDRLLEDDGLRGVRVIATSTRTGHGLDTLRSQLAETVRIRAARTARIVADVERVAGRMADDVRAPEPPSVGRRERARLAEALEVAAGVPAIASAAGRSYRASAARSTGWPVTRWVIGLRRDPLRRLGLGPGASGGLSASQALPLRTPVARAQVSSAVRAVTADVSAALPPTWQASLRRAVPADDPRLAHVIDEAVTGAPVEDYRRPLWWKALGFVQILLLVALVGGLLWLAALFAVAWLRLPDPPTAEVGVVPLPTLLVLGGIVGGLLVAFLGRILARVGGRRRARRVRAMLRERLVAVAGDAVLGPLRAEMEAYGRVRSELVRAGARI